MHIQHIEIANFRKLNAVRVDLSGEKTVLVGANNSGKTSAMVPEVMRSLMNMTESPVVKARGMEIGDIARAV